MQRKLEDPVRVKQLPLNGKLKESDDRYYQYEYISVLASGRNDHFASGRKNNFLSGRKNQSINAAVNTSACLQTKGF